MLSVKLADILYAMVLGIDVGGTKTLAAVLDDSGQIVEKAKFETPQAYAEFILKLEETVKKLTTNCKMCVVALPGRLDRENGIGLHFGNLPWENVLIQTDLSKFIACPIYIENDARLAGLSEAQYVSKEYSKVLYLTISTGIGSSLIVDGHIDREIRDAEAGHMLLEHEGKMQRWEDFASGRAIVARTGKRASELTDENEWKLIAHNIALGLINVIANVTPDCVIIGGGVGSHLNKFKAYLEAELAKSADEMLVVPPILNAKHAEEAVVYGCYVFASQF
jgi:glucokinase